LKNNSDKNCAKRKTKANKLSRKEHLEIKKTMPKYINVLQSATAQIEIQSVQLHCLIAFQVQFQTVLAQEQLFTEIQGDLGEKTPTES